VQLVGTAHGNTLENLIMNPTLSDLVGGIQTVTLGDEEARRRHTQKSVLERKAPPTFDVVVEIMDYYKVVVHPKVIDAVDATLHQRPVQAELRWMSENGEVRKEEVAPPSRLGSNQKLVLSRSSECGEEAAEELEENPLRFYLFGVNRSRLEQVAMEKQRNLKIITNIKQADLFVTTRSYYSRKPQKIRDTEALSIPIYVLKSNNIAQMRQCLNTVYPAASESSYIHHLQRLLTRHHNLNSGKESAESSNTSNKRKWRRGKENRDNP